MENSEKQTLTRAFVKFLIISAVSACASPIYAEGGCPPGQYPQNGQGFQNCVPIPGYEQQSAAQTANKWVDRWQAVAADMPKGILGTSKGFNNAGDAENAAMSDCKVKGGTTCEIQASAKNGCISMVAGENTLNFKSAATKGAAELQAVTQCQRENSQCTVRYSDCSPPERVD